MPYRVAANAPLFRDAVGAAAEGRHAKRAALAIVVGLCGAFVMAVLAGEIASRVETTAHLDASRADDGPTPSVVVRQARGRVVPVSVAAWHHGLPDPHWGARLEVEGSHFIGPAPRVGFYDP